MYSIPEALCSSYLRWSLLSRIRYRMRIALLSELNRSVLSKINKIICKTGRKWLEIGCRIIKCAKIFKEMAPNDRYLGKSTMIALPDPELGSLTIVEMTITWFTQLIPQLSSRNASLKIWNKGPKLSGVPNQDRERARIRKVNSSLELFQVQVIDNCLIWAMRNHIWLQMPIRAGSSPQHASVQTTTPDLVPPKS